MKSVIPQRACSLDLSLLLLSFLLLSTITVTRADEIPKGSYQQSCRNISVDQYKTLHASCRHPSGAWIEGVTLANFDTCVGDIFNFNGLLECARAKLPTGSYRDSCADIYIDAQGKTLTARCRDFNGGMRPTSLDLAGCEADLRISNVDGYLTCIVFGLPSGSYLRTCRNFTVSGSTISGWCRQTNGNYVHSSFDFKGCIAPNKDITNQEGTIACVDQPVSSGGSPPRPPQGCPYQPEKCPPCPMPPCPTYGPGGPQYPPGTPQYPFSRSKASSNLTFSPADVCKEGFVWREAFSGDHVCVSAAAHTQAAQDNSASAARRQSAGSDICKPGFVWREATPTDHVCVTPEVRRQTVDENQHASERKK
ncbi:MAG TPA: CVNH domain-containing protein [Bryobacteraceae bacterium]|jgi:hypothetical protein|nr:CVNH domain-containing protein [Bryobacteraceae bacterium]